MKNLGKMALGLLAAVVLLSSGTGAKADDWGRFYHYPYSNFPVNYRAPFRSADFPTSPNGYPMYPQYMALPPYYRKDLYYGYLKHMKPGGGRKLHYQGNHYVLDVF